MIAENQTFKNIMVHLDGGTFIKCRFEHCTMAYSGLVGCTMINPKFVECKWVMQGPALETLRFLGGLYKMGAKTLVESVFDGIRGKSSADALNTETKKMKKRTSSRQALN